MKIKTVLTICFVLGLISAVSCQKLSDGTPTLNNNFTISEGEDWSFPSYVKPKFRSGFGIMDKFSDNPQVRNAGTTLTWSMLNPEEGVYDFSEMDKWLNMAKSKDGLVLFRLKASVLDRISPWPSMDFSYVPEWVVKKHDPKTFYTRQDENGNFLLYIAPWDDGVQQEFKKFIEEFARRKYFEHENLLAVYLHGISQSYGEEFWITKEFTPQLTEAGLTPERIMKCFKDRMDWWSDAAGVYSYKLAWVGAGDIQGMEYPKDELDEYAFSKGFGIRGGFIEHYFYQPVVPPVAGQRYENDYVVNDYSHYMHDGRIFGDECEQNNFGDAQGEELKFIQQSCFYQAARVGINFLWVSDKNISWAPKVADWYTMVAGKMPEESPDASCWLREAYVRDINGDKKVRVWKNFERMLMQRDMEGARTVPTVKYNLNSENNSWTKDPNRRYEYAARKTDIANGQRKMVFLLDDRFEQSLKGKSMIKITWLDNSTTTWDLIVSVENSVLRYGTIEGHNSGKWKTASITVDEPLRKGSLTGDVSFELNCTGEENITVKHVRVIRLNE